MPLSDKDRLASHNRTQRRYFERAEKPGMIPADTPYLRRHVDELLRYSGVDPGKTILEIGCGMGRYSLLLADLGFKVDAVDLSQVLLDRLQDFDDRNRLNFHCLDVIDHPPEWEGAFDAVVAFFALHHVHDLLPMMEAASRILKPGGIAVFLEPNPYNPLYYIQMLITPGMTFKGERGLLKMRRKPILGALSAAGFTDLGMRRFGFFPPFVVNRPLGAAAERVLERVPVWKTALPFQLFRGTLARRHAPDDRGPTGEQPLSVSPNPHQP